MLHPIRQLNGLLVIVLTFFPYFLLPPFITEQLPTTFSHVSDVAMLLLQLSTIGWLWLCRQNPLFHNFKLFWQYLLLAAVCLLIYHFLPDDHDVVAQLLVKDFTVLFALFFILLAIETNPHLNPGHSLSSLLKGQLSKTIGGSVPALFFTVIGFSYFILLPAEFAQMSEQNTAGVASSQQALSVCFKLLISSLILLRLLVCLFTCQQPFWHYTFGLFALAAGFIIIKLALALYHGHSTKPDYIDTLLSLLPYCLVIIATHIALIRKESPTPINKSADPVGYILVLMLTLAGLHLYGQQQHLFYYTGAQDGGLQSALVVLWLLMGSAILLNLSMKRKDQLAALRRDLTSGLQTQQSLTAQSQQLNNQLLNSEDKAIVRVSNNAILTTSIEGIVLSANPAAVQMFQSLEQELKGNSVSCLFSDKDEMHLFFDFHSNVYALQRKTSGISIECLSLRADGTEFPAQAELQWAEREDQPLIVITFINLTARKLAERQTLELKDKFIANISHEFRTPLTIINGIIDRYVSKTDHDEASKDLSTAKRNGLRLVRMVEQLLELSRLSDNPSLSLSHYRLSSLMAMPVDSFSRLATQQQLSFSSVIPEDLWLECDAQAFEKIIFNLLANAVKYTPAGGDIKVNAYTEQDTIIVDVIDSGIGIHKNSQDKIFERFQRAEDPMNHSTFGVGIGLSLVNELVKTLGWRISLVSEQGQGSKFTLSIPRAEAKDTEAQLPMGLTEHEVSSILIEQRSVSSSQSSHSQQVVLVIEDNPDMQSHIKQVVEQHHHCILAGNGELGLQLAQEYVPDLIVTDLMLPGIDGFEVLKRSKQDEVTAHIPVILLTARSDLDSRLQGLNLNADEYLGKPFNQNELLTRIQNLIDNRKQLQATYVKRHDDKQKVKRREASQDNAAKLTEEVVEQPSLDDKFLAKLEALVAEFYTDPALDIDQLADKLAMSDRQLQRKLKVLLGTNPNNFIRQFRLKKARELLKGGSQIGIVAFDVGFSSQTYFGRCFKEAFGCTPKQYQAENKH